MGIRYPEKLRKMCREILRASQGESASTQGARITLAALYANGVKHMVVSPGSRNAPLVYAADMLEQVSGKFSHKFQSVVRLDERSAGFFALGLSRGEGDNARHAPSSILLANGVDSTGKEYFSSESSMLLSDQTDSIAVSDSLLREKQVKLLNTLSGLEESANLPVAVAVTSGTAVANLHPAVLEAAHQQIPLILLTADRPGYLRGSGANQTTLQNGIFAQGVKACIDVEVSEIDKEELFALVFQAVAYAENKLPAPNDLFNREITAEELGELKIGGKGYQITFPQEAIAKKSGPVQINLCFEPALNPSRLPQNENSHRAERILTQAAEYLEHRNRQNEFTESKAITKSTGIKTDKITPELLAEAVFIAGDQAYLPAVLWAQAANIPIIAEASANLGKEVKGYAGAGIILEKVVPKIVLFTGHPTLSRSLTTLLSRKDIPIYQIDPFAPDFTLSPSCSRLDWEEYRNCLEAYMAAANTNIPGNTAIKVPGKIAELLQEKSAALSGIIREDLIAYPKLDTFKVMEIVCAQLEENHHSLKANLLVGASNSIRALDLLRPEKTPINILANRGLAGIDGTISTAGGLALATGSPWRVLLGDLTFLHDLNGLLYGAYERIPDLHIIVCNDRGGQIFSTLEYGRPEYQAVFPRFFQTPQISNIAALVQGMGHSYEKITTGQELINSLNTPWQGIKVSEIQADPQDFRLRLERITQKYRGKY